MTQSTFDLFGCIAIGCAIAIPLLIAVAIAERPKRPIRKGKSVKLNSFLR